MGLVTIRQKQTIIGYGFVALLVLGLIGLAFKYWYISVPLILIVVLLIIVSVNNRRERSRPTVLRLPAPPPRPVVTRPVDKVITAARIVVAAGVGSSSILQRKMGVPFTEAQDLIEKLEDIGVIGKAEGLNAHPVLISSEQMDAIASALRN